MSRKKYLQPRNKTCKDFHREQTDNEGSPSSTSETV